MKELFYSLLPYWNQKVQLVNTFDYAVLVNGHKSKCFCCPNNGHAVAQVTIGKFVFQVPICGDHMKNYMNFKHPNGWRVMMPHHFRMNPKFKQQPGLN